MRYRALAAVLALTLLSACGTAGNGSGSAAVSAQPPEEPLVLDTLALELPSGTDPALARTFAEALPGEMAKYGVELASVELSFGTSPAATAQALAEGGVDLAFLPNIPTILQVLDGILDEMAVEGVILASEIKEWSPEMDRAYAERWPEGVKVTYIPHSEFDEEIKHVKAVIRTGQYGLHAPNLILQSGCPY